MSTGSWDDRATARPERRAHVGTGGMAAGIGAPSARRTRALLGVTGIALVAAAVHAVIATALPVPWIMPDELIYGELAKSLASGGLPAIRGEVTTGYGILYPLLIAPAWALFDDPLQAYDAAKVINAVVLSLTAFPAYFLARRYVSGTSALVVSGLTVSIPSMLYSGTLLTEVALYPAFVLALLGIAAAAGARAGATSSSRSAGSDSPAAAKPLAVVLVPAYLLIIFHLAVLDARSGARRRDTVRRYRLTLTALAVAVVVVIGARPREATPTPSSACTASSSGTSTSAAASSGSSATSRDRPLRGARPFRSDAPRRLHLRASEQRPCGEEFSALATWTIVGVVAAVAAYASKPSAGAQGYAPSEARLHERNLFVIAPLLLIGMAIWLERGRPGSRRLTIACTVRRGLAPAPAPARAARLEHPLPGAVLHPLGGDG